MKNLSMISQNNLKPVSSIAVLFGEDDLHLFRKDIDENWLVISDFKCGVEDERLVIPKLSVDSEMELSKKTRVKFEDIESRDSIDSLIGFANNFYECTVAPVAAYIEALNILLESHKNNSEFLEVWFPYRNIFQMKYSAYYMAEHESQGRILYSRSSVFQPYLLEICKNKNIKVKFKKVKFNILPHIYRVIRVAGVYGWRLVNGIRLCRIKNKCKLNDEKENEDAELIVVTRSVSQTEFIAPFLLSNKIKSKFITAETANGRGGNNKLIKNISLKHDNISVRSVEYSIWPLIHNYLRSIKKMLFVKDISLEFKGVRLNLNQAMIEVLSMWPEILTYRDSILNKLKEAKTTNTKMLLSTEQKSPHAHIDAWIAKQCDIKCIHLMQCDQQARPLPFPVFGDYFLADSALNSKAFSVAWPDVGEKVKYIGSFKGCGFSERMSAKDRYLNTWCFFAQVDDIETNNEILNLLEQIGALNNLNILIKLHPRDNIDNYKKFENLNFILDGSIIKDELYSSFEFGITFSSGVVLDLIFRKKPFILLRFGKWYTNDAIYIKDDYALNASNPEELAKIMVNSPEYLVAKFDEYWDEFYIKNNIITNSKLMYDNLNLLCQ